MSSSSNQIAQCAESVARACPLCNRGASLARPSIAGRVRCVCGMAYRPVPSTYLRFVEAWDSRYYANSGLRRFEEVAGTRRREACRVLVEKVSRSVTVGRWLDIGCGTGTLLAETLAFGWEPFGIDVSARAVAVAQRCGLNVICGSFPQDMIPGLYDVVSMTCVLEHVESPGQMLAECKARLRPGGRLVLQLKNLSFWMYMERFYRDRQSMWRPEDVQTFTPRTIRHLLRDIGFETQQVMPKEIIGHRLVSGCMRGWGAVTGQVISPNMIVLAAPS